MARDYETDDQFDNDRPRQPREDRGFDDGDDRVIRRAKGKVRGPAVALIVTAILTIIGGLYFGASVSLSNFDEQYDVQIAQNEAKNPNWTPQEKKEFNDKMTKARGPIKSSLTVVAGLCLLTGLVTLVGGVQMLKLKGKALTMIGSLLSIIPCTSGCCFVIGLPIGIWAIIVLGNQDVKAGYAAVARQCR